MNKNLEIVLADVCCSNGKKFCPFCPSYGKKCINYTETELIKAIKELLKNEIHSE